MREKDRKSTMGEEDSPYFYHPYPRGWETGADDLTKTKDV